MNGLLVVELLVIADLFWFKEFYNNLRYFGLLLCLEEIVSIVTDTQPIIDICNLLYDCHVYFLSRTWIIFPFFFWNFGTSFLDSPYLCWLFWHNCKFILVLQHSIFLLFIHPCSILLIFLNPHPLRPCTVYTSMQGSSSFYILLVGLFSPYWWSLWYLCCRDDIRLFHYQAHSCIQKILVAKSGQVTWVFPWLEQMAVYWVEV